MHQLRVSAPGRVCLFGEHQDYLGLPVIAAAIDLRIAALAEQSGEPLLEIDMPDVGERIRLDPRSRQQYAKKRDYLRSCVSVLQRRGLTWSRGYRVEIRGEIPINAGVSSSSAMVIMWLRFLMAISDQRPVPAADDLARLGHEAEVLEFGEPGGMMDHFCAALGGVLYIETVPPFRARPTGSVLDGIVLGNSLEPKATIETLARTRAQVAEGVRLLTERFPSFDLANTPLAEVETALTELPATPARRLRANLVNRDLTVAALGVLERGNVRALGELLLEHHAQLRDGLDLSTPKIERMLAAAMGAGALGGKINGSGGGGCMFAFAPGKEQEVAAALERAGGKSYVVKVAHGAYVETV